MVGKSSESVKLSKIARVENKQHIKHAPPKPYSYNESKNTLHVKSITPFMSAIKRIEKMIKAGEEKTNKKGQVIPKNNSLKYITVKGMGKSMIKVLNIGLHFQNFRHYKVEIFTKTIGVLDEFKSIEKDTAEGGESDDDEEEDVLRKRNVSSIEIRIHIS